MTFILEFLAYNSDGLLYAFKFGLMPIVCIKEVVSQGESKRTEEVNPFQALKASVMLEVWIPADPTGFDEPDIPRPRKKSPCLCFDSFGLSSL